MALNFSRQGRLRLIIAVVIVALGVASGGYWYFGHYTKTPAYSLRMIQEAIQAHDQKQFERYVDVDSIVDNASDALLEGMMDADHSLSEDARATISGFAAMFREPLRASFKNVIIEYVRTGEWGGQSGEDSVAIDSNVILTRTGLKSVDFRRIDSLEQDEEAGTATIGLRVYQEEVDGEFVLKAQMIRTASGLWQVKEITNFRDFITLIMKARQTQLKTYLEATDAILARHEANVKSADRKLVETLHRGSLGDTATRQAMKKIVQEEILPDWKQREAELDAVPAPQAAQVLQRLRRRICEARIRYAEAYAEWLDTKSAATIHQANELLKEATTLENEAAILRRLQEKQK